MLPGSLASRLAVPVVAAPMTGVSGRDLVVEACRHGVIGSFPTHNTSGADELDRWLRDLRTVLPQGAAPVAPNLVVHRSNPRLSEDLAVLTRHQVELVITSVGSPELVVGPLHDAGTLVFADVATMRHVERALDLGVDGLVLLTAGAGGQTGWYNPFAFVRAVRERFDGPVVLAGGGADGAAVLAAQVLGADLVYMGTRFIATRESLAVEDHRAALVRASIDDIAQTTAVSGLPANFVRQSLESFAPSRQYTEAPAGFDFANLVQGAEVWAAGHTAHAVKRTLTTESLITTIRTEYELARRRARALAGEAAVAGTAGKGF